ncbi:MAG: hypothetical protein HOK94_08820 [Candidatus Marinimicrobia bacterium]|nr:hypothetical protein [Candidatus Neomarinimicrobiota bacterium]
MIKALTILLVSTCIFAEIITIPNSTVVPVKTLTQLSSSQLTMGTQMISGIVVAQDVKIKGKTVIKAGTPVYGSVQESKGPQMAGIAGKIVIALNSTVAVDGTNIAILGSFSNQAKSEIGATVAVGVILCPLALLNTGDAGIIPIGAQQRAMTMGSFEVSVD